MVLMGSFAESVVFPALSCSRRALRSKAITKPFARLDCCHHWLVPAYMAGWGNVKVKRVI